MVRITSSITAVARRMIFADTPQVTVRGGLGDGVGQRLESVGGSFRWRRSSIESAVAKKVQRLLDDLVRVHDERVGIGEHQEIGHTLDLCSFH